MAEGGLPPHSRAPRSDATRNRLALLDAAKSLFAAGGAGVTLEAVARQAELGIGTLYRHFPTRAALYEAVYRRDIDQIVELAAECLTAADAAQGLRLWLHAAIDMIATKKGMIAAFALSAGTTSAISAQFTGRLLTAIDPLMARAVARGRLRDEVSGEELFMALVGMAMARSGPGWESGVRLLIDNLLAGLSADRAPPR